MRSAGRDDDLVNVAPLLDDYAGRFADPDLNRAEPQAVALSALRRNDPSLLAPAALFNLLAVCMTITG